MRTCPSWALRSAPLGVWFPLVDRRSGPPVLWAVGRGAVLPPIPGLPGSSSIPATHQVSDGSLFCLLRSLELAQLCFSNLNLISKSPAQGVSQRLSALNKPAVYSTPRSGGPVLTLRPEDTPVPEIVNDTWTNIPSLSPMKEETK